MFDWLYSGVSPLNEIRRDQLNDVSTSSGVESRKEKTNVGAELRKEKGVSESRDKVKPSVPRVVVTDREQAVNDVEQELPKEPFDEDEKQEEEDEDYEGEGLSSAFKPSRVSVVVMNYDTDDADDSMEEAASANARIETVDPATGRIVSLDAATGRVVESDQHR